MERKLKLTISILVSNRKDTVPKCLESLRPILENVDSELIITDTGCDNDLVEYMRKYTDNIVKFKWCNDFAAARNVGLNMARGEWFMYIDDDEWFDDVTEIIKFFNSEEEKDYVAASYVVRNYFSMRGDSYSEGVVGRIFKVFDNARFVGKVHECVRKAEGKEKQFHAFVHHYGYAFKTEEEERLHFERNTSLLIKEIETNPTDARNYAHIYQEYRKSNDTDMLLKYAMEALNKVDESNRDNQVNLCSTYVGILWAYTTREEYAEVINWGDKFKKNKLMTGLAKAAILSYMAEGYMRLEKYEECINCTDEYIKIHEIYKQDKERFYKELAPMLNDTFREKAIGRVLSSGVVASVNIKNLEKALSYLLAYDWSKKVMMLEPKYIGYFIDMLADCKVRAGTELFEDSVRTLGKLFTNIEASNIIIKRINNIKEENPDGYIVVCNIMAGVAGQIGYKELVDVITANRTGDITKLYEVYELVLKKDDLLLHMEKEFFEVALSNSIDLERMISNVGVEHWMRMLRKWSTIARNKDIVYIKRYMDKLLPKDSSYMKMLDNQIVTILDSRRK